MNERIKELAEQASKEAFPLGSMAWMEKFAELIVRECMTCSTWVGKNNTNSVEPVHTAHAINQRIKEHFGVEE
jgi:hypothetical protein